MILTDSALKRAVEQAVIAHPRLNMGNSRRFMRIFIRNYSLNDIYIGPQLPFWQVLRNTLNECELKKGNGREAYKALVGFYCGRNGNSVALSRKKRGLPARKVHLPQYNAIEETSGQLTWQL